jgi:putative nucleotidyltransferase with HDIG domain
MLRSTSSPQTAAREEVSMRKVYNVPVSTEAVSLATAQTKRNVSREVVLQTLQKDSSIPALSASAQKLQEVLNNSEASMDEVAQIVRLDPGLTSRYLKLSNSVVFGGKSITNIDEALVRIGMVEIKRIAMAIGVIDRIKHLRVKVDWSLFLLHSLLTARLTECLAGAYRPSTGKEYLAGLLHDIGKLFLEHYFPQEFEAVMLRAIERNCSMYEVEKQLVGITHAEISAALCEKWALHREICRSVRFHHEPDSPFNKDPSSPEEQTLLAICVCVADAAANMCKANIQGVQNLENVDFDSLTGWGLLQQLPPRETLALDVGKEFEKAQEMLQTFDLQSFGQKTPVPTDGGE